ncbi:hypothetical protein ASU35_12045, partial [Acetivibrio ethanolgignens]
MPGATPMRKLNTEGMGFNVVAMGQGFASMSPPTKELMKLTLECQTADYLGRFPQIISDGNT